MRSRSASRRGSGTLECRPKISKTVSDLRRRPRTDGDRRPGGSRERVSSFLQPPKLQRKTLPKISGETRADASSNEFVQDERRFLWFPQSAFSRPVRSLWARTAGRTCARCVFTIDCTGAHGYSGYGYRVPNVDHPGSFATRKPWPSRVDQRHWYLGFDPDLGSETVVLTCQRDTSHSGVTTAPPS